MLYLISAFSCKSRVDVEACCCWVGSLRRFNVEVTQISTQIHA